MLPFQTCGVPPNALVTPWQTGIFFHNPVSCKDKCFYQNVFVNVSWGWCYIWISNHNADILWLKWKEKIFWKRSFIVLIRETRTIFSAVFTCMCNQITFISKFPWTERTFMFFLINFDSIMFAWKEKKTQY